ncbi:FmdB family zinc ribbon protein [Methyloversatilis thermotolerans]|uniref:FmdB family zinc ribbon protein n=1 Tax=Methyloversatilis thermotolerans TaxID=1346290 RepID=UPI00037FC5AD|nr:zinc ribbon domain-containing protein [Methyloversatilis thermotolerans]
MPIFEFRCRNCDKPFEKLVRGSSTEVLCPACGSNAVDKLVSAPMAPGRSKALIAAARSQAKKEGHFSNYSAAERARIK